MVKCLICNKEFSAYNSLSYHITKTHNIDKKDYYDTYVKKENEGICRYCKTPTNFISISQGYYEYCSFYCSIYYKYNNESEEHKMQRLGKPVVKKVKYSRKDMTPEQKEKDHISHVNAQRNRTEEQKRITSEKLKERCRNRSEEEKREMYRKMVETKRNWSDEKKQKDHEKRSKNLKQRWANMSEEDYNKFKETCKNSYHTKTEQHIDEINEKRHQARVNYMKNKPSYNGIYFDSMWEHDVYKYCIEHNIPIIREPTSIKYTHNNITKTAYPDFEIDGKLVEIKGKQFVNKDGTWSNPYLKVDDGFSEAKHQALLKNNVIIWYENDVDEFLNGNLDILYKNTNK